jgi:glycine dehydrogenase subunit 1
MLKEIPVTDAEQLFADIPKRIMYSKRLNLPHPTSEYETRRHVEDLLSRNRTSRELISFLGAGCWPHYVPAVCDEINSRSEFLTAYAGDPYTDLGRYQALFEFQSMIGELVGLDVVSYPWYDWGSVAADAVRMASTVTGRREVLVPRTMSPDRLAIMRSYCDGQIEITFVKGNPETGQLDPEDLKDKASAKTAAIYIENPTYLGFIETGCEDIAKLAHDRGALFIAGVEPLSLGILTPPGEYGADIACGEGQPLGLHPSYGGALLGFLACKDEERLVSVVPHRLISITRTEKSGEWGFCYVRPERTMFAARDKAGSITGTATALWAITAAVYMSLLGPSGIQELAKTIMEKSNYAMKRLAEIEGVRVPLFDAAHFEEFTVNLDSTRKPMREINRTLMKSGVIGGKDISNEFPELGNTSLFCVTETHTKPDIDKLAAALEVAIQ